jgi:hypothetical protein
MKRLIYIILLLIVTVSVKGQVNLLSGNLQITGFPSSLPSSKFLVSGNFNDTKGLFYASDITTGMWMWKGNAYYVIDSIYSVAGTAITFRVTDPNATGFISGGSAGIMELSVDGIPASPQTGDSNSSFMTPADYSAFQSYIASLIGAGGGVSLSTVNGIISDSISALKPCAIFYSNDGGTDLSNDSTDVYVDRCGGVSLFLNLTTPASSNLIANFNNPGDEDLGKTVTITALDEDATWNIQVDGLFPQGENIISNYTLRNGEVIILSAQETDLGNRWVFTKWGTGVEVFTGSVGDTATYTNADQGSILLIGTSPHDSIFIMGSTGVWSLSTAGFTLPQIREEISDSTYFYPTLSAFTAVAAATDYPLNKRIKIGDTGLEYLVVDSLTSIRGTQTNFIEVGSARWYIKPDNYFLTKLANGKYAVFANENIRASFFPDTWGADTMLQHAADFAFFSVMQYRNNITNARSDTNLIKNYGTVYIDKDVVITNTISPKHGVNFEGIGSIVGRIYKPVITVNLNDSTKTAISLDNSIGGFTQFAEGGLKNISMVFISPAYSAINLNEPDAFQMDNVFIDGNGYAKFGVVATGTVLTYLSDIRIGEVDSAGVYFPLGGNRSTTFYLDNTHISYAHAAIVADSNTIYDMHVSDCVFEHVDKVLYAKTDNYYFDNIYTEAVAEDSLENMFEIGFSGATPGVDDFSLTNSTMRFFSSNRKGYLINADRVHNIHIANVSQSGKDNTIKTTSNTNSLHLYNYRVDDGEVFAAEPYKGILRDVNASTKITALPIIHQVTGEKYNIFNGRVYADSLLRSATSSGYGANVNGLFYTDGNGRASTSASLTWNGTTLSSTSFTPTGSAVPSSGVFLPESNRLGFATNSRMWFHMNSFGGIMSGTNQAGANQFEIVSDTINNQAVSGSRGLILSTIRNATTGSRLRMSKYRGGYYGNKAAVQSGDNLGTLDFTGYVGTTNTDQIGFRLQVDAIGGVTDASSGVMSNVLFYKPYWSGSARGFVSFMQIDSLDRFGFGANTSPNLTKTFYFNGSTLFSGKTIVGADSSFVHDPGADSTYIKGQLRHVNVGEANADSLRVISTSGVVSNASWSQARDSIVLEYPTLSDFTSVATSRPFEVNDRIKITGTGAEYLVGSSAVTGYTTDTVAVIPVSGGKYAVMNSQRYDPRWFGADNSDATSDRTAIAKTSAYAKSVGSSVYFGDNTGTYIVDSSDAAINLYSDMIVDGNGAKILFKGKSAAKVGFSINTVDSNLTVKNLKVYSELNFNHDDVDNTYGILSGNVAFFQGKDSDLKKNIRFENIHMSTGATGISINNGFNLELVNITADSVLNPVAYNVCENCNVNGFSSDRANFGVSNSKFHYFYIVDLVKGEFRNVNLRGASGLAMKITNSTNYSGQVNLDNWVLDSTGAISVQEFAVFSASNITLKNFENQAIGTPGVFQFTDTNGVVTIDKIFYKGKAASPHELTVIESGVGNNTKELSVKNVYFENIFPRFIGNGFKIANYENIRMRDFMPVSTSLPSMWSINQTTTDTTFMTIKNISLGILNKTYDSDISIIQAVGSSAIVSMKDIYVNKNGATTFYLVDSRSDAKIFGDGFYLSGSSLPTLIRSEAVTDEKDVSLINIWDLASTEITQHADWRTIPLPYRTTAKRPVEPKNGDFAINSTTGAPEFYKSAWYNFIFSDSSSMVHNPTIDSTYIKGQLRVDGATQDVLVDAAGYVGINSTPSFPLDVNGDAGFGNLTNTLVLVQPNFTKDGSFRPQIVGRDSSIYESGASIAFENGGIEFRGDNNYTTTANMVVDSNGAVKVRENLSTESTTDSTQAVLFQITLMNTTGGALAVKAPASPVAGDWFAVSDTRGQAGANNITIAFTVAAQNLHGSSQDHVISTNKGFAKFVYVGPTIGWIVAN